MRPETPLSSASRPALPSPQRPAGGGAGWGGGCGRGTPHADAGQRPEPPPTLWPQLKKGEAKAPACAVSHFPPGDPPLRRGHRPGCPPATWGSRWNRGAPSLPGEHHSIPSRGLPGRVLERTEIRGRAWDLQKARGSDRPQDRTPVLSHE